MFDLTKHKDEIRNNGFTIIENIYNTAEVDSLINAINTADKSSDSFRKTNDLFAIRRFLKEIPAVQPLIFTEKLKSAINRLFGPDYFLVKSIYFDKPEKSNWFVAWHQDLTIAVDNRVELPGFGPWTTKFNQFAVQPPVDILQNNFTVRIHLDDTDEFNGALKIIPGSHLKGVQRLDSFNWKNETGNSCEMMAGSIMIMHPLLVHSSNRTTANRKRRVIHLEFSKGILPEELHWAEQVFY